MKRKERRLISVVSGFETKQQRSRDSLKLLSWGFRNTDTFKISKFNETFFELETWLGKQKKLKAVTKEDLYLTLNKFIVYTYYHFNYLNLYLIFLFLFSFFLF